MAQTGFTPISNYYSTTASAVPTAANLVPGELAINTNDGKLYYEDSSGVVRVLASKSTGSIGGSTTQVQYNLSGSLAGSANLVFDGNNVGLGTSSPVSNSGYSALTISGSTGGQIYWKDTNTSVTAYAGVDNSTAYLATSSNHPFLFRTNNTERMRITAAGNIYTASGVNVGIGTSSPITPLNIMGQTTSTSTPILYLQQGGSFPNYGYTFSIDNQTTGNLLLRRYDSNADIGSILTITGAGVVTMPAYGAGAATFSAAGVISSVSDETWKVKDGVPTNPDAMLQKLEPGYWFYNDKKAPIFGEDRQLGFYAQNVHEAIGSEAAPTPEEGKPWGYYDRSVLAVVVMSLKNALNTIEELKQRITALENK